MIWIFLAFGANFISCRIRICIPNVDPDPGDKSNTDPDPKTLLRGLVDTAEFWHGVDIDTPKP